MITINSLKIDQVYENINVDVVTPVGSEIIKMLVFTKDTYKDYSKAIDLSSLLSSTTNTEVLTIPASALGLEKLNGVFFIEFESNEVIVPTDLIDSNVTLGLVSNFIKYHNCLLERVLTLDIIGCEQVKEDCVECNKNLPFISTLLQSLNLSITFGNYEESIKILNMLDDMCDICHTCPEYGDTLLLNGLGFGTVDNTIISI